MACIETRTQMPFLWEPAAHIWTSFHFNKKEREARHNVASVERSFCTVG
jgi:hypothetical protein